MGRFIIAIGIMVLAAPFWVQFILAAAVAYLGYSEQQSYDRNIAERAALLQSAPPATIKIDDFHGRYDRKAGPTEVALTAQIATEHNTHLVEKRNFITVAETLLFVLVDADATKQNQIARAAFEIPVEQKDAFLAWAVENVVGAGDVGLIINVSGLMARGAMDTQATKALKEQGLSQAPDFFYIHPYLEGRAAYLAAKPNEAVNDALWFYNIAMGFALYGVLRLVLGRFAKKSRAEDSRIESASPAKAPFNEVWPDSVWKEMPSATPAALVIKAPAALLVTAPPKFNLYDPVEPKNSPLITTTPRLSERLGAIAYAWPIKVTVRYAEFFAIMAAIAVVNTEVLTGGVMKMQSFPLDTTKALPQLGLITLAYLAVKIFAWHAKIPAQAIGKDPIDRILEEKARYHG